MDRPTLAKDIMVTKLVTLSPEMDAFDAIELLLKHRISGAPVVDGAGNYLGVFSEKCSMSVIVKAAYDQLPASKIQAFMDTEGRTITEDTDLLTIVQIFEESGNRRLPVLRDGKLIGQLSRRDVLQAAHAMMRIAPDRQAALLYLSSLVEREDAPIAQ
jgi:CBS domain-containing protein